jgi:transcriptional regulator of acetoin/glycerol metabolism
MTEGLLKTKTLPLPEEESPFDQAEAGVIEKALKKHAGDRSTTARELGIGRTTLWRKIKKYGLA